VAALPGSDNDLETVYSIQNVTDVATKNDVRVEQTATAEFAIHQFKDYHPDGTADLEWEGQSNIACASSTVYLQVYNRDSGLWETIDSDNSTAANTDFTLSGSIADTTDYKDGSNVISCRVYQEMT